MPHKLTDRVIYIGSMLPHSFITSVLNISTNYFSFSFKYEKKKLKIKKKKQKHVLCSNKEKFAVGVVPVLNRPLCHRDTAGVFHAAPKKPTIFIFLFKEDVLNSPP